jgi:soluble lytic murein transglycosylase-like protein
VLALFIVALVYFAPEVEGDNGMMQGASNQYIVAPRAILSLPEAYLESITSEDEYKLLFKIIQCESGWNPLAKNQNSTASGLFQFIASTWNSWGHGDVFNYVDNLEAGVRLYRARGTSPWLASVACWR